MLRAQRFVAAKILHPVVCGTLPEILGEAGHLQKGGNYGIGFGMQVGTRDSGCLCQSFSRGFETVTPPQMLLLFFVAYNANQKWPQKNSHCEHL